MRRGGGHGLMSYFWNEVADAAQSADRSTAELAAQAVNVDFDGIAADLFIPAVQAVFELRARQHGSWPLQQGLEYGVFVAGQRDRLAFAFDRAGHRIEAQVAVLNARIAAARGTTQHRTHAGGDFVQIEGFDDVIVGACIESRDSVLNLVASRENDDRRGVASLAQLAQHIDAVAVRQPKVEQHQVEMRGLQGGPRALAVAHPIHGEGRLAKRRVQALPNHFIVFNEQYTHAEQYPIAV